MTNSKINSFRRYLTDLGKSYILDNFMETEEHLEGDINLSIDGREYKFRIALVMRPESTSNDITIVFTKFPRFKTDEVLQLINELNSKSRNGRYAVFPADDMENNAILYRLIYTSYATSFDPEMYYNLLNNSLNNIQKEFRQFEHIKVNVTNTSSDNNYSKTNRAHTDEYKNISYNNFLHNVYDDYNISITSEDASRICFNDAITYRREGSFSEAIDLHVKSIQYYLFNPNLKDNFYSMAKTYYLMNKHDDSLNCYRICLQLSILQNIDPNRDIFVNIGHAMFDRLYQDVNREIAYYRSTLIDKPLNNEHYKFLSKIYDDELSVQMGVLLSSDIENMKNHDTDTLSEIKKLMLHYTGFRDMNA